MASHDSWKQQHVGNVKLSDDDWQFHPKTWKGPQHVLPRSQPFINNKNMANPPDEYAAAAFRKLDSVSERRDQLQRWYPGLNVSCLADGGLSDELANGLIENTVSHSLNDRGWFCCGIGAIVSRDIPVNLTVRAV